MTICNILIKENDQDSYAAKIGVGEDLLDFSISSASDIMRSNVRDLFSSNNFILRHNPSDLLDFAMSIYSIDQIVSRKKYGYQGWSRHLKVHFPVADLGLWNSVRSDIEQMLSFLSGDKWQFLFRQHSNVLPIQPVLTPNPNNITKVSLFSGGLDSFISAVDLLGHNEKVAFVSHYKSGSESPKQRALYSLLETKYGQSAFLKNQFYVQPNQKHQKATKEDSSRARSFLFLVLGISVANSLGNNIELVIPENGLISLNIPLTQTRLSSHSTRTTHPFYLSLFKKVIQALGISNPIINPYQFQTKGEMMLNCNDRVFLQQHYADTLSCSHPDNSRFVSGSRPGKHCGYCVPCIIRQAAEHAAGRIKTDYARHIKTHPPDPTTKTGRDLRAFKMALIEINNLPHHSMMLRILRSGPLPFTSQNELSNYIAMYKRGMQEVGSFLQ